MVNMARKIANSVEWCARHIEWLESLGREVVGNDEEEMRDAEKAYQYQRTIDQNFDS